MDYFSSEDISFAKSINDLRSFEEPITVPMTTTLVVGATETLRNEKTPSLNVIIVPTVFIEVATASLSSGASPINEAKLTVKDLLLLKPAASIISSTPLAIPAKAIYPPAVPAPNTAPGIAATAPAKHQTLN